MHRSLLRSPSAGLVIVLLALGTVLTLVAGSHVDPVSGRSVNNFLNAHTLIQMGTDASTFAIMGVGATLVIIAGGIDLSVGAVYCPRRRGDGNGGSAPWGRWHRSLPCWWASVPACWWPFSVAWPTDSWWSGWAFTPFIITLGTMWVLRGIAFVMSHAESILVPTALTNVAKAPLGLGASLSPVPLLGMLAITLLGTLYLTRTVMGRHVFAFGGNAEASRFSGLRVKRIQVGVFLWSGLTAGFAAFLGAGFYGSATSSDGTGYELYVIAAAVVGGASLTGGKGSALGATLGALLIVLIRQAIRTLHLDPEL